MKKEKGVNQVFKFWVENKLSQERNFFVSDIRQLFQKWLLTKEISWLKYYSSQDVVLSFISDKNGLNAVHDLKDTDEIVRMLKPDYKNIVNGINPKTKLPMCPIKCPDCDVFLDFEHTMQTDRKGILTYYICPMCVERWVTRNNELPEIAAT
jgi:hypothetical protein